MNEYAIAFVTGLFGSIHCLGMCGPLAFAIPSAHTGSWLLVWDKLVYQLGRVASYTLLGIIVGIIGKQLWMAGLQQGLSILSGMLIILGASIIIFKFGRFRTWLILPVSRLLSFALKNKANHLVLGILNGFLPCGFVSLGLAGAVNTGSVQHAGIYMAFFGAGTIPLMFIAALGTGWVSPLFRRKIGKVSPYFMIFLGAWFILRGMTLNIHYISPAGAQKKAEVSVCQ